MIARILVLVLFSTFWMLYAAKNSSAWLRDDTWPSHQASHSDDGKARNGSTISSSDSTQRLPGHVPCQPNEICDEPQDASVNVLLEPPIRAPAPDDVLKNRYISIDPRGASGTNPSVHHIRVTLDSTEVIGQNGNGPWWAGEPDADCISVVAATKPAVEPDWTGCSTTHLTGCPIIPTTTYALSVESGGALSADALFDTQARPIPKWHGDVVGFFTGTEWTAPNGNVSIDDAVAAIKTFQNPSKLPGCGAPPCNATHTSVTDVAPNLPPTATNKIVNIEDVLIIILGFGGQEYPGGDLGLCPDLCGTSPDGTPCDDGDFCTLGDTCQSGVCVSGVLNPLCPTFEPGTWESPPAGTSGCSGGCGMDRGPMRSVYLFSGEFYESAIDARIRGRGIDFVLGRKYRSRIGKNTVMGNGWDYSYNIFLEPVDDDLNLQDGNSREDLYTEDTSGDWTSAEFLRVITQNADGSYTLTFCDNRKWMFNPFDGSAAQGKINSIVGRNGNAINFEYDPLGRLITIHDTLDTAAHNRDITIAYNAAGFIASITDFTGRQLKYEYYPAGHPGGSAGDLKSVTTPAIIGTPTFNDFPLGRTTVYTYSTGHADDNLNHNLLTITDPNGQTFLSNVYASTTNPADLEYDRVVRQVWGDPGDIIDAAYASQTPSSSNGFATIKAIVNDRVGNVEEHFFDAKNQCVIVREYTGRADPDLPTTVTTNRPTAQLRASDPTFFETRREYDNPDGLNTRVLHPNLNEELFTYDEANTNRLAQGNLLQHCRLPGVNCGTPGFPECGDQAQICEQSEYVAGFGGCCGANFISRHVDARGNATEHRYDSVGNRTQTTHRETSIVEDWDYDVFGQVIRYLHPDVNGHRREDIFDYYTIADGAQNGYPKSRTNDATGFALTTIYHHDAVGNLVRVVDPRGFDRLYTYNESNEIVRELSQEVSAGSGLRYQTDRHYDANGNITQTIVDNIADPCISAVTSSWLESNDFDVLNRRLRVTKQVDASHATTTEFEYDENGNLTLTCLGEANTIRTSFDERDLTFISRLAEGTPDQMSIQKDYDGNRNLVKRTIGLAEDPTLTRPRITCYGVDGFNRRIETIGPTCKRTLVHYDHNGNVGGDKSPGTPHPWGIQELGKRMDSYPLQQEPGCENCPDNDPSVVRLYEEMSTYDKVDRRTERNVLHFDAWNGGAVIGDGGSVTTWMYVGMSQVASTSDDNGATLSRTHDTMLRSETFTDAKGNTLIYSFDGNDNIVTTTEIEISDLLLPDEIFVTMNEFDGLNRMTHQTDPLSHSTVHTYDSRSNIVKTVDRRGNTTCRRYNGVGRLVLTRRLLTDTGDGGGTVIGQIDTSKTWDDSSRLVSRTDANGNTTTYTYNVLNRKVREDYADGTAQSYGYNLFGDRIRSVDSNGTDVRNTFDDLGRLVERNIVTFGPGVSNATTFERYRYDGKSRLVLAEDDDSLVVREFDSLNRVLRETQTIDVGGTPTVGMVTRTYDGVGNKLRLEYPNPRAIDFTYDVLRRVSTVSDSGTPIADFDFIGRTRIEQRQYLQVPNTFTIRSTYSYDGDRQITRVLHQRLSAPFTQAELEHGWDEEGNMTSRNNVLPLPGAAGATYGYDSRNRLVRSIRTPPGAPAGEVNYLLDGANNRIIVVGGADAGAYLANSVNGYTSTPAGPQIHDNNGNVKDIGGGTRTMEYDYANQLVSYTGPGSIGGEGTTTFKYDTFRRRIQKTQNQGSVTRYFYDRLDVIEEQDVGGATLATYVYSGLDKPLQMQRGGQTYNFMEDANQTIVAMSGSNGLAVEHYEYDDYGKAVFFDSSGTPIAGSAIGNNYLFTGRRFDPETGLLYYRNRYHDVGSGRFIQRDRIGMWGDNLSLGNPYAYVANNPQTYRDPTGNVIEYQLTPIVEDFSLSPEEAECQQDCNRQHIDDLFDATETLIDRLDDCDDNGLCALWATIRFGLRQSRLNRDQNDCLAECLEEQPEGDCVNDTDCANDEFCTRNAGGGRKFCRKKKSEGRLCSGHRKCASGCCKYHLWSNPIGLTCRPARRCN